jgi:hypothetical protein
MAKFSTFIDDFETGSTLDSGLWTINTYGNSIPVSDGSATFDASSGSGFYQVRSAAQYDITSSHIYIGIDSDSVGDSGGSWGDGVLLLTQSPFADDENPPNAGWFSAGSTYRAYYTAEEYDPIYVGSAVSKSSVNYLRVREASGTLFYEHSTNGTSWTTTGSVATSTVFSTPTSLYFNINNISSGGTLVLNGVNSLPPASPPTVTTGTAGSITTTTATITGSNVTSDGGAVITERGVVYNTSSNPTTANSKVTSGGRTGTFNSNLTGLSMGTTYYVRAYAINSEGTSYGSNVSFTTNSSFPGDKTQLGRGRIQKTLDRTQLSNTRISKTLEREQTSVSYLNKIYEFGQGAIARLSNTLESLQDAVANIRSRFSYSRGDYDSLPTDSNDLTHVYDSDEMEDVAGLDEVYVDQGGTSGYAVHQYRMYHNFPTANIEIEWTGKVMIPAFDQTVYLQIYNFDSGEWETLAYDDEADSNEPFSLYYVVGVNQQDYYDEDGYIAVRIYQ